MTEIRDELWLRSPAGVLLTPGVVVTSCKWTLIENSFGKLTATGPLDAPEGSLLTGALLNKSWLDLDARFEVHRFLDGQALGIEGNTQFLLRYWDFAEDGDGRQTWNIEAYTPEYCLTGRHVDSWASTDNTDSALAVSVINPLTTKSGAGDDVIKALVRENAGASTTLAARKLSELSVDSDTTKATATELSCAWKNLYSTLNDLVDDQYELGKWISWGMVASGTGTGFTFRTWPNQRGVSHTAGSKNEVIVSKDNGNLLNPRVSFDHRAEWTAVRALGKGEGASRVSVRVEDTARSKASPFAYRETVIQSSQITKASQLTALARAELRRGRPVRAFSGKMLDTDYARYGERVKWGDLVTASAFGYSFACRLATVTGSWSKDGEVLDISLSGEVIE